MATYTCPTCGTVMQRDMTVFTRHTDQHIMDEIKRLHPKWVAEDGFCPKCLDFFKQEMRGSDGSVNIGAGGVRQRSVLGIVSLAAAVAGFVALYAQDAPRAWRLVLFFPFFMAALGLIQAKQQVCVVFGAQGVRQNEKAHTMEPIRDEAAQAALRRKSKQILLIALAVALLLTASGLIVDVWM